MNNTLFVTAGDIAEKLGISKPFAYNLVRQMNDELEAKGFLTIAGRVSRKYYEVKNGSGNMAAYKDEKRGTWFVSFHYNDWTGKNCRKVKRGFKTRREAVEWEQHFLMKEGSDLDMTFSEFVAAYTRDMQR